MRRLILVVAMLALLSVMALPAMAQSWGNPGSNWWDQGNNRGDWSQQGNNWRGNRDNDRDDWWRWWGRQNQPQQQSSCDWYWSYWHGYQYWCWSPYYGWYLRW
jgi:hypothetical protein